MCSVASITIGVVRRSSAAMSRTLVIEFTSSIGHTDVARSYSLNRAIRVESYVGT